jgi:hypothetical protein
MRSIEAWQPRAVQQPPELPMLYNLKVFFASMWQQGVRSDYRGAYWSFLWLLIRKWSRQPAKLWLGFMVLLSANHFLKYARGVSEMLDEQCVELAPTMEIELSESMERFVEQQVSAGNTKA